MSAVSPLPRTAEPATSTRQPPSSRWLLLPLLLTLVAGGGFYWMQASSAPTAPTTTTVSQGSLTVSVSGSGAVAANRSVALAFQQTGQITNVAVRVGDKVTAGQTLATLDSADLKLQLQQAQAALDAAQAKLEQAQGGGATPQDTQAAQAALDSANAGLAKTRTGNATAADLRSAAASVAAAQAKLDVLKNPTAADLSTAQSRVNQAQAALQNTRDGDSQAKNSASLQLQNAVNSLTAAQSKFATAQQNWQYVQDTGNDPTQPSKTVNGKTVPNKLDDSQRQQYYDTFVQAQTALQTAQNGVTQAQLSFDAARQKEATDVPQAEQALQDAQTQLAAIQNPDAAALTQAQAQVIQAQAALDKLRQGGTANDVTQAQAQVTQAQINLEKLTAPAASSDLTAAKASVAQAQASFAQAQRNLEQGALTAPFDGVVAAVAVQEGAAAGSSATITVVDRSTLNIAVSLSEGDVAKITPGQGVTLTFDALPGTSLIGKVETVAPAATVTQNVVTYPVQIAFDPGSAPVLVGMSATAEIQVQQIDNALLVPSRAVQTVGSTKQVSVLVGPRQIAVPVGIETGATVNGQTVVLSCTATGAQCLQAGDVLALPTSTTTRTTTTTGTQRQGTGVGGLPFGR